MLTVPMMGTDQRRQSRDGVWPLRNAEGLTYAEAQAKRKAQQEGVES